MSSTVNYPFPKNFIWGAATAATQIEGAAAEDGKGPSIWDDFSKQPGRVHGGHTPEIACDHYHRFPEDIRLIRKLGLKNYRLSIAWPRILPEGRGAINQRGLDFYRRLIDTLLDHEITPWVTMFHWDLPLALEHQGGWRNRGTAEAFGTYADTIVKALGDRVKNWITLNEIPCFIGLGYKEGRHAPGAKESPRVINQAYHHAILAHGQGVRAVREHGGRGARVGLTHNPETAIPLLEIPTDIAAARRSFAERNAHILAPIFHGRYPAEYLRRCGADRPVVAKGDFALIAQPTDFLGINIYTGYFVRAKGSRAEALPFPAQYPRAASEWLYLAPQAMYWVLNHCHALYQPKAMYVTENGVGYDDEPAANGEYLDLHRRDYLRQSLLHIQRATQEKIPCKGYFLWSLIDNFEWADGYTRRFGIVHNDFETQKRTPKLSAHWYQQVVKQNRLL